MKESVAASSHSLHMFANDSQLSNSFQGCSIQSILNGKTLMPEGRNECPKLFQQIRILYNFENTFSDLSPFKFNKSVVFSASSIRSPPYYRSIINQNKNTHSNIEHLITKLKNN